MRKSLFILSISVLSLLPLSAAVQGSAYAGPVIYEGTLAFGSHNRSGDALNASGSPFNELENYESVNLRRLVPVPVSRSVLFQPEFDYDNSNTSDYLSAVPELVDDTYSKSRFLAAQVGWTTTNLYFGGFGGSGRTEFPLRNLDQTTNFDVFSLTAQAHFDRWSIGGQLSRLDSSASNPESLSNANFGVLTARHFFNGGNTSVGLSAAYASGDQVRIHLPARTR